MNAVMTALSKRQTVMLLGYAALSAIRGQGNTERMLPSIGIGTSQDYRAWPAPGDCVFFGPDGRPVQGESIRSNGGKLAVGQHLGREALPTGFPGDLEIVPKE